MSLIDSIISAARLKILQLLAQSSGYALNNEVIRIGLDAMGIRLSADQVRCELSWLAECRVVKLLDIGPLIVAELTERGHDVSKGVSEMRGIDRPLPGAVR